MRQYRAKEKRQLFYDEFLDNLDSDKYYACYRAGYIFGKTSLLREKRRTRPLTQAEMNELFALRLIQNSCYGASGPKYLEMPMRPISIILSENVTPGKKISVTVLKTRGGEK